MGTPPDFGVSPYFRIFRVPQFRMFEANDKVLRCAQNDDPCAQNDGRCAQNDSPARWCRYHT